MITDDITLIQRILSGDETAFANLLRKYQKQVHTRAYRKIGDFHIAEDITQETFLQVYQKLRTLEDPTRFLRWLYVIVDRLCIAWYRKNQLQTQGQEEFDKSEIETEAYSRFVAIQNAEISAEMQRYLVEKLLERLEESNRTIITLHYFEGMTYREISNFLGVSEGTIKSRIRRARQRLKKEALDITIEQGYYLHKQLNGGFGMKLTFQRDDLLYSLQAMRDIANGERTSPIISNVLIHAEGSTIECMATDMEIGIRMKIEGTVKKKGSIVVSVQKLENIVKALPAEKPIDLVTTRDNRGKFIFGDGAYKTFELADDEFPQLPCVGREAFTINGEALQAFLYKTEFAASPIEAFEETSCFFLNRIYFNPVEDRTEVVAADGKQLAPAYCDTYKLLSKDSHGFILPLKIVREIDRTFANSSEIRVSRVANQILFGDERATLMFLVGGRYVLESELTIGKSSR